MRTEDTIKKTREMENTGEYENVDKMDKMENTMQVLDGKYRIVQI